MSGYYTRLLCLSLMDLIVKISQHEAQTTSELCKRLNNEQPNPSLLDSVCYCCIICPRTLLQLFRLCYDYNPQESPESCVMSSHPGAFTPFGEPEALRNHPAICGAFPGWLLARTRAGATAHGTCDKSGVSDGLYMA